MNIRNLSLVLTLCLSSPSFAADEIHWTITGQTSVTFDWRGSASENKIRYGTTVRNCINTVAAVTPNPTPFSSPGPFWEAKLTGLLENTLYYYSIGNNPVRTFRTPPPLGSSNFFVYAEGDIGSTNSYRNVGPVQDLIATGRPAFVLAVGDLTYGNAKGQDDVDQHFNDVMAWSQLDVAYMPAWGNHEWDKSTDDLRNYKGRFAFPNPQTSPGSPSISCCGEDWYWFDYGNARFIAYPEPWSGAWSDWQTKAGTIMAQAQADPTTRFIVTFGHRPAYSSGHHPSSSTLQRILKALGDTYSKYVLNLNGHSHNYERTHPQHGVVHITIGTGGSSLEQDGSCLWLTCTQPAWSAFRAMRHGVLRLHFTATGIQGAFICGSAGGGTNDVNCTAGDVVDNFTLGNQTPPPLDTTPPSIPTALCATAASTSQINLAWSASTDNVGVAGYKIYRNGSRIGVTTKTSYNDSNLDRSTAYTYRVYAYDAAGNTSAHLSAATATTLGSSSPPGGSILTFLPIADASIKYDSPTANFGTSKLHADASPLEESLLKFDVTQIGQSTITAAKLRLHNVNDSDNGGAIYRVANNSWSESTVTWNTAPAADPTPIASLGAVAINTWVEVDVTPLVTGDGSYSLRLKSSSSNGADYASRESFSGFAPKLIVTLGNGGPSDSTAPTLSIVALSNSATVTNTITVTANASKNVSVAGVQFILDGSNLGSSVPQVPRPGYLSPITDPVFNTEITRITADSGAALSWAGPPSGSGFWGADARHHYSKDQPWSSDNALLMLQNSGSPSQVILDGETYQVRYGKCSNYNPSDDRWHPSLQHPRERINVRGTTIEWFDVVNCAQTRSWTLPLTPKYLGNGEGNVSNDGRFVLLADATHMFLADMDPQAPLASYTDGNKRIGPTYDVSNCGLSSGCIIDWVSVSPSGKYAVVSYKGDHLRIFDINPNTLALSPRLMPLSSVQCSGHDPTKGYIFDLGHADMALNPFDNDEDVIIGQRRSWCPPSVNGTALGSVIMVRLADNTVTTLTDPTNEATAHQLSTRSYDRPGWVYAGYYQASARRFNDEIVAIKMDGSKAVERLAHKHGLFSNCYRCEAHGVPSRDGKRVLWASNWAQNCGSSCGPNTEIKAYVVDARP